MTKREELDSIPVYAADSSVLKHLPGYSLVRGILCAFRRRKRLSAEALIDTISYEKDWLAVILGSEGPGLREETIRKSGHTVKIPMSNGVDSLNVAAASAVDF